MRLFDLARRPTRLIRLAILAWMLAFGVNALAHAAHSHSAASEIAACGSCLTFAGIADAPRHSLPVIAHAKHVAIAMPFVNAIIDTAPRTQAQPRAPPAR